ncbi:MAG: SDR family oxidoreductase [Hyphomicrobiaceae bacterium]|nr:SDR family oxidoreductase [Hyphomicrobiaceae bacterium]
MDVPHLLALGLGYSATALARVLAPRGTCVTATSTSAPGLARIAAFGYRAMPFDRAADAFGKATHVVVSAPPGVDGDPVLATYGDAIVASSSIRSIAYLSTIGVYGNWNGDWVDETCDLRPSSDRSHRRADAERAWLDLGSTSGKEVIVFRLAGIYGPGQSAIDNLRAGTARRIVKPGQVFNRIHVDDIAGIVALAFASRARHRVYNVADDEPTPPQDVVAYAAELLGLPIPPDIRFEQAQMSAMGASFYAENKRASNARAKGDLGWRPLYPSYREGLKAILDQSAAR